MDVGCGMYDFLSVGSLTLLKYGNPNVKTTKKGLKYANIGVSLKLPDANSGVFKAKKSAVFRLALRKYLFQITK